MAILDSQLGLGQQPTLVQSKLGLRAEGIGKSFNKRRVVRNVSIKLDRGEAVGLLGPNGAGKTTTFYMLAGLIPADEGSVFINGQDVTTLPIFQRARLEVLDQDVGGGNGDVGPVGDTCRLTQAD